MRWKLFSRLFDWQYVHLKNTSDHVIRRVQYTNSGERYVRYWGQHLIFIDKDNCDWIVTDLTKE